MKNHIFNISDKKSGSSGYTLVEMLIVVALSGFVGTMIFSSLYKSKDLFKKSVSKTESLQQIRDAIGTMSRDIQNVVRSSEKAFVGLDDQSKLHDTPISVDSLSLSLFSEKTASNVSVSDSFVSVKYFVDYDKKENQLTLNKVITSIDDSQSLNSRVLCRNIRGVNFRYLKNGVWHEKWNSGGLPDAVEITIALDNNVLKSFPDKLQTIVSIVS